VSGYLARLAASVNSERSAIHPLVAPLFASPQETAELPAVEEERFASPRRPTEVPEAPAEAHLPAIKEQQIASPRRPTEVPEARPEARRPEILRPRTSSAANGTGEPRSEQAAPVARTRPQAKPVLAAPDETSSLSVPAGQFSARPLRNAEEAPPVAGSYTPLLVVNDIQNAAPSAPGSVKQLHTLSSPLHRPRRVREPDEVQIHIGRIEVTAVAPSPSSRPPITPARKSPSLDEYLKRGTRR
jgi:hypothetical protein